MVHIHVFHQGECGCERAKKKRVLPEWERHALKQEKADLRQPTDVLHQAAFEVGSLIFMDIVLLRQAIDHGNYLGKEAFCFTLLGHCTEVLDRRTGAFLVKTVAKSLNSDLTHALLGGLMVGHVLFFLTEGKDSCCFTTLKGLLALFFTKKLGESLPASRKGSDLCREISTIYPQISHKVRDHA